MKSNSSDKMIKQALAGSLVIHLGILGVISWCGKPVTAKTPIDLDHIQVIDVERYHTENQKVALSVPESQPETEEAKAPDPIPPAKELPPTPAKKLSPSSAHLRPGQVQPASSAKANPGQTGKQGGNPGGYLNMGSGSANGDLNGFPSGGTSLGSVPSPVGGEGSGSGTGAGVGTPEPVSDAHGNGRETAVASAEPTLTPPPPPPAKKEEDEPKHHSRLADRSMPEAISEPSPNYPSSAQEDGIEGIVRVKYVVNTEGSIDDAEIVKSSGNRELDNAALAAVRRYRYKPAVQDGTPRSVTMMRKIVFKLD